MPTLLLWGAEDRMIPARNAADYLAALPDARLVTFPGVGHVLHEEAADGHGRGGAGVLGPLAWITRRPLTSVADCREHLYNPRRLMMPTTLSSREFNQDTSRAKKAAADGPVFITDRGRPAHVLLTIEDYQKLGGSAGEHR